MRLALLTVLILAFAACGSAAGSACPDSEALSAWQLPGHGQPALSQCDRVAEFNVGAGMGGVLTESLQSTAASVSLSADFELLDGEGEFQLFAGQQDGPAVRMDSGALTATGKISAGWAILAANGLAAPGKTMRWRVSNVRVTTSP